MSLEQIVQFVKLLIGKDKEWQGKWNLETEEGRERLEEDFAKRGLGFSGVAKKKLKRYGEKRAAEFKDEVRRRWSEGLGVIPPWLALVLSVVALIISVISLLLR